MKAGIINVKSGWRRVKRSNYHLQQGEGPSLENIAASNNNMI
jgi:hypothetical protein